MPGLFPLPGRLRVRAEPSCRLSLLSPEFAGALSAAGDVFGYVQNLPAGLACSPRRSPGLFPLPKRLRVHAEPSCRLNLLSRRSPGLFPLPKRLRVRAIFSISDISRYFQKAYLRKFYIHTSECSLSLSGRTKYMFSSEIGNKCTYSILLKFPNTYLMVKMRIVACTAYMRLSYI